MIEQLPRENYRSVASLFAPLDRHPIVQGVLEGSHSGMVFTDRSEAPRAALLWAISDMLFIAGASDMRAFNQALPELLATTVTSRARDVGQTFFQIRADPAARWAGMMPDIFARTDAFLTYRSEFSFDAEEYAARRSSAEILDGCAIREMDAAVLDAWPAGERHVFATWPDARSYRDRGVGYCAEFQGEFVGSCIVAFRGAGVCELSVNTEPGVRRRGIATRLCRAMIDECLRRGLLPCWGTETFRLPSLALAHKLGFHHLGDVPTYCFQRDEPANPHMLGAYFYSESRGSAAESASAGGLGTIARGWSLAGGTTTAARFAEEALATGSLERSELASSPDFERLRASPEWRHFADNGKLAK